MTFREAILAPAAALIGAIAVSPILHWIVTP